MSVTTVVIPALNEAPVIGEVVRRLRACQALQEVGIRDILVVDNGSDDETSAVARAAGARVVQEPRRGYGRACLAGVQAAKDADVIILMDGDGSDVPEDLVRVWQPVQAGVADLAMGSRARGQREPGALTPQQRVGNAVGAVLLRLLYGVRVSDIGPLRAIRRETLLRMEMSEMTYGWSAEMLAKAGRLGLRIEEIPVDYRRRAGGTSKVAGTLKGTVKASGRILRTILRYWRWQPGRAGETALPPSANSFADTEAAHPVRQATEVAARGFATRSACADSTHAARSTADSAQSTRRQALFIVARLPVAGQTKTRLSQGIGVERATDLYRAFLRDLGERFTQAAARDGYDLYWFYAAPDGIDAAAFAACVPPGGTLHSQEGADFAARLWHGFETLSARGYERVVVIGSDSPHLPAAWVRQAFAALATHEVVIGPAQDGGYYLLGQRASPAPVDLFTGIKMSTATVCAETLARAEAAGLRVARAPATFDVDEAADLERLRAALHHAPSAEADSAPATLALLGALPSLPADAPLALAGNLEGAARGNE